MSPWAVPGYAEERELGRGASGRVVAATSTATGQRVAIKYLSLTMLRDPASVTAFRAEAGLLKSLQVPQVVRMYDYAEEPGQGAAIVMELVDGISLHQLITRHGPASPEAALTVLKGSLLGLAAAHALGIVHRDYKPENVLVDAAGASKLSDFGVAVRAGRKAPALGTPLYMAPEQWAGADASPASDVYAATAVFFECLTGKTPFRGALGQLQQQHESAAVPVWLVDAPLRGLITRGMAKSPRDRPAVALAFLAELEAVAVAAYGAAWEERGRSELARRAVALLGLLARGGAVGGGAGTATAATWLASHARVAYAGAAVAAAVVVTVAATALAIQGGPPSHRPPGGVPVGMVKVAAMAAATAMPPVAVSSCASPATFTFQAALSVTAPGTLSYRWVYSSGKEGPVRTLRFAAAGTRQVSGGAVATRQAASGWAEVQVLSPVSLLSNKASYRLMCTSAGQPSPVTATATAHPASTAVTCGTPPPAVTFTGAVTSSRAGKVTYYWAQSDGTDSAPASLELAVPGTRAVPALMVTPPGDTASGGAEIIVTAPGTAASNVATYTLSCHPAGGGGTGTGGGGTGGSGSPLALSASASASPATQNVTCGATPRPVTFSGTITASEATIVTYHWLVNGGPGPVQTLAFTQAGTLPVAPLTSSPPADPDPSQTSGSIVITSPRGASSTAATSALSCTQLNVTLSDLTASPADSQDVTCGSSAQFTVTGTVSSNQDVSVPYQWARDGALSSSGTAQVSAGSSTPLTDTVTVTPRPRGVAPSPPVTDTLTVTTPTGVTLSKSVTLTATCTEPVSIITTTLPGGTEGQSYTAGLSVSGGNGTYQWSASGLPPGLSIDSGTGTISGTPGGNNGTYPVTVTVTSAGQSASKTLSLFIGLPLQ